jgi:hypothetical protein
MGFRSIDRAWVSRPKSLPGKPLIGYTSVESTGLLYSSVLTVSKK